MSRRLQIAFWLFVFLLLGLTRIELAAKYLSIDNVNLALALENFDPNNHQPQPPGYPFFVGFARLVNLFSHNAETTFLVLSLLVTALCLPVIAAVGRRLFTEITGTKAALLLLLNPVFWQSGLDGPLRVNLALFSLLVAYCSWRAFNGERNYVFWGACALGIGSGFRPDLLVYLFPLWIVSAIIGTRSLKTVVVGLEICAAIVLIWVGALVYAVGGPSNLYTLARAYVSDPSTQVIPLQPGWVRQVSRLVAWNGLAVFGWIWTIPVVLTKPGVIGTLLRRPQILFVALWVIPGFLFQALFHVAAPGHTLFSVPVFCVLGGYFIVAAAERLSPLHPGRIVDRSVMAALVVNVILFLGYFPLPAAPAVPSFFHSVKNSMAYGTLETSIHTVRDPDKLAGETLKEIFAMTPADAPWIIVTTDAYEKDWFTNWRIIRYYVPETDIWVMAEQRQPKQAIRVRREETVGTVIDDVYNIEVPKGGRILWLLELKGPVLRELQKLQNLKGGKNVFYTDVPTDAQPFQLFSFRFVPVSVPQ